MSADWKDIFSAIEDVSARRLLSGLIRYCSARRIAPAGVSFSTIDDYLAFRDHTTFHKVDSCFHRSIIKSWNRCAATVAGWPTNTIVLPELASTAKGPDWQDFPQGLRSDIDTYLNTLAQPHRGINGKRWRGCKPSTLATRRREIVALVRTIVAAGVPLETISSLKVMLSPVMTEKALGLYLDRNGERPKTYTIDLAWKIHAIAKSVGLPEADVARLDEMRALLEDQRGPVMTEKNIAVIRSVMAGETWPRVVALPHHLLGAARRMRNRHPFKAVALATAAVQIAILVRAPIRIGNLLMIRFEHNLKRLSGDRYRLHFPNHDVKNRVDLDFILEGPVHEVLSAYLAEFRPLIAGNHQHDWLFPAPDGAKRSSAHASKVIAELVERHVGLRVTAHQFRHAAAAMILKAEPGNYEFARRVLGHKSIATTTRFYTGLESFQAAKAFNLLIDDQLKTTQRETGRLARRISRKLQNGSST